MKIAKERKSSILASNAVHHRIDSLTSVVALVAIGGSHLFTGTSWLDPVGGLIVSLMVIKAGWGNTGSALLELADVGIDDEMRDSVRNAASKALEHESFAIQDAALPRLRNVQGVKAGQNYLIDLDLIVPDTWTVLEARRLEDAVRNTVGSTVRGVRRVKIRMVPSANDAPGFADEFIGPGVMDQNALETDPKIDNQHHRHEYDASNSDMRKRHQ